MIEPLIVECYGSSLPEGEVKIEITEDMTPQVVELEKGDTIRFRDNILTVSQAGIYRVGPHGVSELGRREGDDE